MAHVRSVEQQYWNLAQSHVQLWSSDRAVALAQGILDREKVELVVGKGTIADVAEAEQRLEQFNLDLVTRTSDTITVERQLRNILGLPPADNRRIIPVTPPTEARLEPDWDISLAQMLNFQPDIVQQQILVRVAELQLLIARNQLLPQLSLNALYQLNGLGQQLDSAEAVMTGATLKALNPVVANMERISGLNSPPGLYNNFVTWQVGFTFQAPLGMRAPLANTRSAQYVLLRARAYLQQIVHQTTHSLARFFLEIDANYKQFKTASRLRQAAATRLEAQRAYYEEGKIPIDRFLDAVSQYATAVATEAQYKTTYNISIVALEEAKGTLLAYDNIAVAEGPHPRKAYIQARDIQNAHRQFHISPDGPQVPQGPTGPVNPDPVELNPPPGVGPARGPLPEPAPAGPLPPGPNSIPPFGPARVLPTLSGTMPEAGSGRPVASATTASSDDLRLTSGSVSAGPSRAPASILDPTVPGVGANSVAASLGRSGPPAAQSATSAGTPTLQAADPSAPAPVPPRAVAPGGPSGAAPVARPAPEDLPPLPVTVDLPPLPPG
jgi:outer membrane protein TolC